MAPAGQISAEHDQRLAEIAKIAKLERRNGRHPANFVLVFQSFIFLVLLSQKVAANGEQNHLFGKIHTSAMGGWNGSAKIE
jgi:hypothetical protein